MSENCYALFRSRFPADRSDVFIELDDGTGYSFGTIDDISARMARLFEELGILPGDRIAVQVEKSPEAICLYVACLRYGAIFLPMNTAYQKGEIEYILADAEPALVVCRPESETIIRELAAARKGIHVLTLGHSREGTLLERSKGLEPLRDISSRTKGDVCCILYTSGTTGRPKGAMLTHGNLASNTMALHRTWQFQKGDVLLHALPIFHAHGLFVATNLSLYNPCKMIFLPRFDVDAIVRLLPRASVFMGVPTFYVRLLADERVTRELCGHVRLFVAGSAPLLEETFNAWKTRTGMAIVERYGMTETVMNTSNPIGAETSGSCGKALPGVEVRVTGENGSVLAPGEVGNIEVRGPNVFKGYWRNPEKTKEDFRADGFFITGDVGKIDAQDYVWIVGRAKDLIISGGYNVYPKEVEIYIDRIEGVDESAVFGVPHPDFGEGVAAAIKRKPGHSNLTADAITAKLKAELAHYKIPKKLYFLDELPRNAMGKVQKKLLREQYKDSFTGR
ncbi:MAG TPA: malonyl-CoA synthase [Alphaproteobacteria bacterium]|nr:malonyl-CoA synthase [Alphaproteobacteria bacterium]